MEINEIKEIIEIFKMNAQKSRYYETSSDYVKGFINGECAAFDRILGLIETGEIK